MRTMSHAVTWVVIMMSSGQGQSLYVSVLVRKTGTAIGCRAKFLPINALLGEKKVAKETTFFNRKL